MAAIGVGALWHSSAPFSRSRSYVGPRTRRPLLLLSLPPLLQVSYYYVQMMASMKKAGFKPIMFADAFGTLNGTGTDLRGTDIVFDGWDTGTPGSLAAVIQAPGVKVRDTTDASGRGAHPFYRH